MNQSEIQRTRFTIESLPGMVFEGFSDGSDWNGWACPWFEKAEAERVLTMSESNGYAWTFDESTDAFAIRSVEDDEDYEPEVFAGTDLNIDGRVTRVYGIGGYSWIWSEADSHDETF